MEHLMKPFNIYTVIVTYNGIKWIKECLDSVVEQSKVVVVDNLSTDATVSFIKEHYKDVIVIEQSVNQGFGKGNNIGIKYALDNNADYILLINQDAKLKENSLEKFKKLSEQNPDFGIISPIHCDWSGKFLESSFSKYVNYKFNKDFYSDFVLQKPKQSLYQVPFIAAACWFLPMSTFKKVGGFDPIFFHLGEDVNFAQRVIFHGLKIGVSADLFVSHDTKDRVYEHIERFSDAYFYRLNYREKILFADINFKNWKRKLKHKKSQVFKDALFLLMQLKLKKFFGATKEYRFYKNLEIECSKSRVLNKTIGSHYLN
ncbi:MAG: glycosyl transferase family 2 [Flavobacteriaceae bacterium]|nr:glycosyl transferase family 2 [Flavobacteriaceae bacterium]MBD10680.1 glycosyl transferase family 2 [Flavobacteriaceae bacterium]|tara:strand:- start:15859 stop:16803 length:945 start_codon:yes stop_codon:yes gene_type:complete